MTLSTRSLAAAFALGATLLSTGCRHEEISLGDPLPVTIAFSDPYAAVTNDDGATIAPVAGGVVVDGNIHLYGTCYTLTADAGRDAGTILVRVTTSAQGASCPMVFVERSYHVAVSGIPAGAYIVSVLHRVDDPTAKATITVQTTSVTVP